MITASIKLRGMPNMSAKVDSSLNIVLDSGQNVPASDLQWEVPTTGNVFGTLLNFKGELAVLGDAINQEPYNGPPHAPVLYIKPANTWIGYGMPILIPPEAGAVQVGVSLGVVIGRAA